VGLFSFDVPKLEVKYHVKKPSLFSEIFCYVAWTGSIAKNGVWLELLNVLTPGSKCLKSSADSGRWIH
jgi:hypothetical protein